MSGDFGTSPFFSAFYASKLQPCFQASTLRIDQVRLPASAPAPARPTAPAANQSQHKQQQHSTDRCIDDSGDHSAAQMDSEPREHPTTDECADDPEQQIANEAEAAA